MASGRRAGARQAPAEAPVFRKVLYERQPFPDDYTDANFLAELILNLNVRRRSFWVVRRTRGWLHRDNNGGLVLGDAP